MDDRARLNPIQPHSLYLKAGGIFFPLDDWEKNRTPKVRRIVRLVNSSASAADVRAGWKGFRVSVKLGREFIKRTPKQRFVLFFQVVI